MDEINEKTKMFEGLTVPVRIECDAESKKFEIYVETPSTASLLLKEIGMGKGSMSPGEEKIGDVTLEQVMNVVDAKKDSFLDKTYKAAVKTVLGTANSIGLTVEGENSKVIQNRESGRAINEKILGCGLGSFGL